MYSAVVFDLDGTLLNTIDDLADSANYICNKYGFPIHEVDKYRYMVGNGNLTLTKRFLPATILSEDVNKYYLEFIDYYKDHSAVKTAPYEGIIELLKFFKENNIKVGMLTNKTQSIAEVITKKYFGDLITDIQGNVEGIPVKPDPTGLYILLEKMGCEARETLFVGDTNIDIMTGHNGNLKACGVLWGFRDRHELEEVKAEYIVNTPEEIKKIVFPNDIDK